MQIQNRQPKLAFLKPLNSTSPKNQWELTKPEFHLTLYLQLSLLHQSGLTKKKRNIYNESPVCHYLLLWARQVFNQLLSPYTKHACMQSLIVFRTLYIFMLWPLAGGAKLHLLVLHFPQRITPKVSWISFCVLIAWRHPDHYTIMFLLISYTLQTTLFQWHRKKQLDFIHFKHA